MRLGSGPSVGWKALERQEQGKGKDDLGKEEMCEEGNGLEQCIVK